jgi:[ribosomal protein S5]-alanine N-acetyltransferase
MIRHRTRRARWRDSGADRLPVLDAGPFALRGFRPDDAAMVSEAGKDPVIPLVATVPAQASAVEAARFVDVQRRRLRDGFGYSFVIAEARSDQGVGSIGLWLRDADQGRASVGYWVLSSARRRGAATCALGALSRFALETLGFARVDLHVEPWNEASIATAESAGFRREGLARSWQTVGGRRRDMYLYGLVPEDLA